MDKKLILISKVVISILIVLSFLFTIYSIGTDMHEPGHETINSDWKELLLLMLGALIANVSKVVDYWFNQDSQDK